MSISRGAVMREPVMRGALARGCGVFRRLGLFLFLVLFAAGLRAQISFHSASQAYGVNAPITLAGVGAAATRDDCGSLTPAIPAGSAGDLLIALVNAREEDATLSKSAAWNALYAANYSGENLQVAVYWRIATGSDALTVTQSGTCDSLAAQVARFSGVSTTSPFDGTPGVTAQDSGNVDAASTTTTSAEAMLLVAAVVADNRTVAEGTGWDEAFDSSLNVNRDLALSLHYQLQSAAGSKSVSNWDLSGGGNDMNAGIIFALRPAVAGRRVDLPVPAGTAQNDVLVAAITVRYHGATVTPPAGWTQVQDTPQSNGAGTCDSGTTAGIRTLSYYKVAGAAESTASFGYASNCNDDGFAAAGMLRFSGVDTASPIIASAEATTGNGTTHTAPALTPGVANSMLVTVHSYGSSRSWNEGYAGVSAMAERVDQRSYNEDNVLGTTLAMYTQSIAGTGSTNTRTAQGAGDADNGATQSLLLRPSGLNHLRIEHDGAGVGCAPESVTIKACADASCSSLYTGTVSTTLAPASGWSAGSAISFSGGSTTASLTATTASTVTLGAASTSPAPVVATRCFNGASETCSLTFSACPAASCNSGALSAGVINTYYPGVSVSGSTITLGSASGASTGLAAGDLVLVVQMQDAAIDTANGATYGTASSVNAGKYEYATVQSVGVGSVTLSGALSNTYSALTPGNDSTQQKTFQVIRVPVYSSGTLPAAGLTAKAWDGSTGGVLAFDVIGTLNLGTGSVVDVSGKGFRGGGGYGSTSGSGSTADYRTPAKSNGANGAKGEGIAGTPYRVFNGSTTVSNAWEGYPNGSNARGAPANAGGGGTDGNPSANDENTGGGGGANKGAGGQGGIGWCGAFDSGDPSPYGCDNTGGFGGKAVSALAAAQLTLGGGGGAATSNNSTGTPAGGVASSGAPGGGIVMIRAGALSGTATINANGSDANDSVRNDGSGGGGAGGAVLVSAASGLNGLTVNARGGEGGSNLVPPGSTSDPHGPGGGGGGGFVVSSTATAGCTVSGGASGVSYEGGVLFGAYGATAGSVGSCVTGLSAAQIPGAALGQGPCAALLHHYAISYPLGNPGVTCEALAVRVTAHDSGEAEVVPAAGTQITLSTTPAAGGWALRTGGGSFSGGNQYTFDGIEKYAEFWLTQTTPTTAPHIDIDVSDGAKSEIDGSASEDAKAQFVDTAFKYYDCSGAVPATCSEISINQQIAGKPSSTAPGAQTLYLRAVRQSSTTGACTGGLSGAQAVGFAYECDNPANCYGSDLLSINGGAGSLAVARNNDGSVSSSSGSYTSVNMTFSADGYAPFTFNYADAGAITLHARKVVAAGSGTPPSTAATIYGASNSFVVRPFAFELTAYRDALGDNPGASAADGSVFTSAGSPFKARLRSVAWQAADDDPGASPAYDGLPNSGANLGDNATTPSFAWASSLAADASAGSFTPLAGDGGVLGELSPSPASLAATDFGAGVASYTPLAYSEVGSFTLRAAAASYLGVSGIDVAGSTRVGRFVPDHFTVTPGTLVNRAVAACAPASAFTYAGEAMQLKDFTLSARNALATPTVTKNYTGAFARLDGSLPANFAFAAVDLADAVAPLAARSFAAGSSPGDLGLLSSSGGWSAGVGTFVANVRLIRATGAAEGPYESFRLGIAPLDPDGVTVRGADKDLDITAPADAANDKVLIGSTRVLFGRLWLGNAYGSDQRDLALPFQTQYWNGTAFVKNTADNCTALATAHLAMGNPQGGLGAYAGPLAVSATVAGGGTITLSKPAGSASGSVDLAVRLGSAGSPANCANPALAGGTSAALDYLSGKWCGSGYDRDPVARATFGVFGSHLKKGPIYIRENF